MQLTLQLVALTVKQSIHNNCVGNAVSSFLSWYTGSI